MHCCQLSNPLMRVAEVRQSYSKGAFPEEAVVVSLDNFDLLFITSLYLYI